MNQALLIFLGGGAGALCRWLLSSGITQLISTRFPLGILVCNTLGALLIGLASAWLLSKENTTLSPLLITGFLGSFTTFSTFALDTQKLFTEGQTTLAILNILLSLIFTILAVTLGLKFLSN